MSKPKVEEVRYPCRYQEGVSCTDMDCDHCGWHPAVAAQRIEEFRRTGHVGAQKMTLYQLMTRMTRPEMGRLLADLTQGLTGVPMTGEYMEGLLNMSIEEVRAMYEEDEDAEAAAGSFTDRDESGLLEEE